MQSLRVAIAKHLRGEHRLLSWDETTAATRMRWLLMADGILDTIAQHKRDNSMLSKIEHRLVDDWRCVLKRAASIKLAIVAPIVLQGLYEVLAAAPPELRVYISVPAFVLLAVGAIVARVWRQPDGK
jgi:hypothetical protein